MKLECEKLLYLREITEADTEDVLRWRNGENVKKYFIYQKDITREEHLNWLKTKVGTGEVIQFVIIEKETDRGIGSVYLEDIDKKHNKAEYGIFIGENAQTGRGYGTLTAKRVIRYAFEELGLHRLYLRVYEDNSRAIASYEKAGFKKEALLQDDVLVNGTYRNIVLMGIVNRGE